MNKLGIAVENFWNNSFIVVTLLYIWITDKVVISLYFFWREEPSESFLQQHSSSIVRWLEERTSRHEVSTVCSPGACTLYLSKFLLHNFTIFFSSGGFSGCNSSCYFPKPSYKINKLKHDIFLYYRNLSAFPSLPTCWQEEEQARRTV